MMKLDLKDAYYTVPMHPPVYILGETVRVSVPAIRPVVGPTGVHQDLYIEASGSSTPVTEDPSGVLSRRYPCLTPRQIKTPEDIS